jgi:hypothetical protein
MRLALSKYARDNFTGGSERVKIGCLRPGFCIMARGRDFKTIAEANVSQPGFGPREPEGDLPLLPQRPCESVANQSYRTIPAAMACAIRSR